MKKWLLNCILCFCASAACAFDLPSAWKAAEQHSAEYRAAVYNRDAEQEKEQQAQAARYPQIHAQADYGRQASDLSAARRQYGWQIQVSQSLYDAEKNARLRQSQSHSQAVHEDLQHRLDDLKLRVSRSYFDVLLADENIQAARTEKETYRKQIVQTKKLFQHGAATAVDVYEARAGYDQALAKEVDALANKQLAQNQLADYTGLPVTRVQALDTVGIIRHFQSQIDKRNLETWQRAALKHNSEYRIQRMARQGAVHGLDWAQAARKPKIHLSAAYQNRHVHRSSAAKGWTFTVQLSVPLYTGGENRSRIREAAARLHEADARLTATERQIKLAVAQAYTESTTAHYQILAQERVLESSRLKLKATETGKQYGIRNTLETVRARQEVAEAEQRLAQARYAYLAAFLNLTKVSGMNMDEVWRSAQSKPPRLPPTNHQVRSMPLRLKLKRPYGQMQKPTDTI